MWFRNGNVFLVDSSVIFIRVINYIKIREASSMEPLTLCWMMDQRWLCKLSNPLHQYILTITIILNLACIAGVLVER